MNADPTFTAAEILEHTGWLRTLARQLVRDPNTADDVVQSTLMAALEWEGVPRKGLRQWLSGVARNTAHQIRRGERRQKRRQTEAAAPEALPSAGEMVELVDSQRALASAVLELDEPYRSTIFLRFYSELQPKDIAEKFDLPASTVRVRLKRGLEQLREKLEARQGEGQHWSLMLLPLVLPSRGELQAAAEQATRPLAAGPLSSGLLKGGLALGLVTAAAVVTMLLDLTDPEPVTAVSAGPEDVAAVREQRPVQPPPETRREQEAVATPPAEAETLAADDCCLIGQVLDADGAPTADARVEAVEFHPRSPSTLDLAAGPEWNGTTRTNEAGFYRIPARADHPYSVRVHAAGHAPSSTGAVYTGELQELALSTGRSLEVTVKDADAGDILAGARVRVESADPYGVPTAWAFEAETDEHGVALFDRLPAGSHQLSASLAEHAPLSTTVELAQAAAGGVEATSRVTLELWRAATVHGVVLDGRTGDSIAGARVEGPTTSTSTDLGGEFVLGGFDPGSSAPQALHVRVPGFAPAVEYIQVEPGFRAPEVTLRLERGLLVSGRVVDDLAEPLAGVPVGFRGRFAPNPRRAERHDGQTRTDAEGRFELTLHNRASYTIGTQAPGFAMSLVRVMNYDPSRFEEDLGDLVLHRAGSLAGVVTGREFDREHPDELEVELLTGGGFVAGPALLVQLLPIGPSGEFAVNGLAPGTYGLTLHGRDPSGARPTMPLLRRTVEVRAGEATADLELSPTEPITGRVSFSDGSPGRGIAVSARRGDDSRPVVLTLADRQGNFRLLPEGPGPFVLLAEDPGLRDAPTELPEVPAGSRDLQLQLEPRNTPHRIRCRVTDEEGVPVTDLSIRVVRQLTGGPIHRDTRPDEDGRLELRDLDEEPYVIHAFSPRGEFEFSSLYGVRPSDELVQLKMRRRP